MSINIKKYTKEQMAQMVEKALNDMEIATAKWAAKGEEMMGQISKLEDQSRTLRAKNAALTEQISQMNGEAINKANEIANLKADADGLRNRLKDTEDALGRANAEVSRLTVSRRQLEEERDFMSQQWNNAGFRADYAEAHPWRNLWAWVKRKLGCKA